MLRYTNDFLGEYYHWINSLQIHAASAGGTCNEMLLQLQERDVSEFTSRVVT